jgi:Peptidase C13 family
MRGMMALKTLFAGIAVAIASTPLLSQSSFDPMAAANKGWTSEQDRSPAWQLAQHQKLDKAIAALKPHSKDVVDAYVVAISLDSDAVFFREASEAARVLSARFSANGRTLLLTAGADDKPNGPPQGSPDNLGTALAAVADRMDKAEDVLVLYSTSHGDPRTGLAYRDGEKGAGMIAPAHLARLLDDLGFERRIILISACYSGIFIPMLTNDETVIVTAASSRRPSFGCVPSNDWTFFGDALINNALRKPQPFEKAADEAQSLIDKWEASLRVPSSEPQLFIGSSVARWLGPLEAKMPKTATAPVGQPALKSTAAAVDEER